MTTNTDALPLRPNDALETLNGNNDNPGSLAPEYPDWINPANIGPPWDPSLAPEDRVVIAIMKPGREDIENVEREFQEHLELMEHLMPLPDGDENDPGNPWLVQKYGDQLPLRISTDGEWETWIDTIGRFYYFNPATKQVKFSFSAADDEDPPVSKSTPSQQPPVSKETTPSVASRQTNVAEAPPSPEIECPSIKFISIATLLLVPYVSSVELAIVPGCTTDASGSASCQVGINPAPPLGASLDGGYQWLTEEFVAQTVAGVLSTKTVNVFTAKETDFLGITTIATTDGAGVAVTTTQTQYVSFITETPSINGAAAAAVIAGVVMIPALVAPLQTIAEGAAGKSVQQIGSEIAAAFGLKKAMLTSGDVQQLAKYVTVIAAAAVMAGKPILVDLLWKGATIPVENPTSWTKSKSRSTTPGSSEILEADGKGHSPTDKEDHTASTITITPTTRGLIVTAIMKPPYENWQELVKIIDVFIALPDEDPETQSKPIPTCKGGNNGVDPATANKLAFKFCTGSSVDFAHDATKDLSGADLDPATPTTGNYITFSYKHANGKCGLSCTDSYAQMITSCEHDSHGIYGVASLDDGCGSYAMTVSASAAAPKPTQPFTTSVTNVCIEPTASTKFSVINAREAIVYYCTGDITLPDAAVPVVKSYYYHSVVINLSVGWSKSGQTGCSTTHSSSVVSKSDCATYLEAVLTKCDNGNGNSRYGTLTYSSPIGCIDFIVSGTATMSGR